MSVTVGVYEYDEEMDEEILTSLGVNGGPFGQLIGDATIEEERELLQNADSIMVGSSKYDYPYKVMEAITGKTDVDASFLAMLEELKNEYADPNEGRYDADEVYDWFAEREGAKVFVKGI